MLIFKFYNMAYRIKQDYSGAVSKKLVQSKIYKDIDKHGFKRVVGLAGPNISDYLKSMKERGIESAEIYEYDRMQLLLQLQDFQPVIKTKVCFDDIIKARANKKQTLYDLDLCCSIRKAKAYIKKFGKSCIVTLALRPDSLKTTLTKFCELIDNTVSPTIRYDEEPTKKKGYKLHTLEINGSMYECYQYKDTHNMVTIKPIF